MATIPSISLIPSGYKAGKVYSVLPTDGSADFDFSRNTTATRINKDGLIENVGNNVPRLDYEGGGCPSLLLEPSRTNLITYSEDFSNAAWVKVNLSVTSGFLSPKGDLSAFKLVENSENSIHYIPTSNNTTSGSVTQSVYAKYLSRYLRLTIHDVTNANEWYSVIYDLENGTIYNSLAKTVTVFDSKIEKTANGYYRCTITADLGVSSTTAFYIQLSDGTAISSGDNRGRGSYTGDGTSGIYIWGAQLEAGSYATSYIPTSGSAQTRLAETANGAGDASTFNDSEGVLMAEISALEDTSYIALGSNSNNRVVLGASVGNLRSYNNIGGTVIDFTSSIIASNNNKLAIKYKSGNTDFYINGFKVFESSTVFSASTPFNEIIFGNLAGGTQNFYGKTKQIQYYNTALTDSELETLTSYTSFNAMALAQNYTI